MIGRSMRHFIEACIETHKIALEVEKELAKIEETPRMSTKFAQECYDQMATDNERLKEELRIAKTSWNFEEGKRIIAERDEAVKKLTVMTCQRDTARRDERRVSGERDELRDKLRATEEAMDTAEGEVEKLKKALDVAEGEVERREEERKKLAEVNAESDVLADKLHATEQKLDSEETYSSNLRSENRLMQIKITEAWKVIKDSPHG